MEVPALTQMLKDRAEAVQTIFQAVPSLDDCFRHAINVTLQLQGSTIAAPQLSPAHQQRLHRLCEESGIHLLTSELRKHSGQIHTGFTLGDWAIAETATVVLDSAAEDVRIATMLSETHVAAVPHSRVRATALELADELSEAMSSPPTYLAFISGASRTADIERVLTIGVHGPQEFHLIILEEEPA